jgi:hypothetical protein
MKVGNSNTLPAASCTGVLLLAFCMLPLSAFAALGENANSVLADQARMKGTRRTVAAQSYAVHEITGQNGTLVREYVAPSGSVFAVVWEGQFAPDLQQLLGKYYQQAQQAQEQQIRQQQPRVRGPMHVQSPELVCETSSRQRSFHGRCYVPQLVPPGTQTTDIQ